MSRAAQAATNGDDQSAQQLSQFALMPAAQGLKRLRESSSELCSTLMDLQQQIAELEDPISRGSAPARLSLSSFPCESLSSGMATLTSSSCTVEPLRDVLVNSVPSKMDAPPKKNSNLGSAPHVSPTSSQQSIRSSRSRGGGPILSPGDGGDAVASCATLLVDQKAASDADRTPQPSLDRQGSINRAGALEELVQRLRRELRTRHEDVEALELLSTGVRGDLERVATTLGKRVLALQGEESRNPGMQRECGDLRERMSGLLATRVQSDAPHTEPGMVKSSLEELSDSSPESEGDARRAASESEATSLASVAEIRTDKLGVVAQATPPSLALAEGIIAKAGAAASAAAAAAAAAPRIEGLRSLPPRIAGSTGARRRSGAGWV